MVLADMHCDDHPALAGRPREFAYMGQGEPGYSYSQVRMAIELTNRAMKELGQTVYRHIVATCGVPETIQLFKSDIQNYYTERVTLHLSLHAADLCIDAVFRPAGPSAGDDEQRAGVDAAHAAGGTRP